MDLECARMNVEDPLQETSEYCGKLRRRCSPTLTFSLGPRPYSPSLFSILTTSWKTKHLGQRPSYVHLNDLGHCRVPQECLHVHLLLETCPPAPTLSLETRKSHCSQHFIPKQNCSSWAKTLPYQLVSSMRTRTRFLLFIAKYQALSIVPDMYL